MIFIQSPSKVGSSIMYSTITSFLNLVYNKVAFVTTRWENNRTRSVMINKLNTKKFLFQFANNYAYFFYLGFLRNVCKTFLYTIFTGIFHVHSIFFISN